MGAQSVQMQDLRKISRRITQQLIMVNYIHSHEFSLNVFFFRFLFESFQKESCSVIFYGPTYFFIQVHIYLTNNPIESCITTLQRILMS